MVASTYGCFQPFNAFDYDGAARSRLCVALHCGAGSHVNEAYSWERGKHVTGCDTV